MNYLPTDNLYKFLAIAGLIIVGFSMYYTETLLRTLERDNIDIATDLAVGKAEMEFWQSRKEKLENITKNSIAQQQSRHKPDSNKLKLPYSAQELKNIEDETEQLKRDLKITDAKILGKLQKTKQLTSQFKETFFFVKILIVIGLILTTLGFLLWYLKVQMLLDRKLKNAVFKESPPSDTIGKN